MQDVQNKVDVIMWALKAVNIDKVSQPADW